MKTFGKIKKKILENITNSFMENQSGEVKDIIKTVMKNKDLKEMYLLYEDIENKHIDDQVIAEEYVEKLSSILKNKNKDISKILEELDSKLDGIDVKDINIEDSDVYSILDILSEDDSLLNLDKKITAKKNLKTFLLQKKEKNEKVDLPKIVNENMLFAVLANNFNSSYTNLLSEEDKKEFKQIMSLNEKDLNNKVKELKESIVSKVDSLILESNNNELFDKLNNVKNQVNRMSNTKYDYYKLKELKNGLN